MRNNTKYLNLSALNTTLRHVVVVCAVSLAYLLLSWVLIGFKTDQLFLAALFSALYLATPTTRRFILGFSIFIVYWIIYDYMKAFPNYAFNPVHIEDLYETEKGIFGIAQGSVTLTPNEFWRQHSFVIADVLAGAFYLCWIPVPLLFAGYLFYRDKAQFLEFSLTFLFVNLLGFAVYYLYPAAPPWYVQNFGFEFRAATPGNTAGLVRFDQFFGIHLFSSLYAKGSNVFAAMPSLHSAYPLIVTYVGIKHKVGWINVVFVIITLGIWFAAVYTSHHYVLDVLAGIFTASVGIAGFQWLQRTERFSKLMNRYRNTIAQS
ncbi:MAG TPA: phosphatase PAP2 family protein [Ohtaekwangia sp.]|uniref:phosphatase PAP2 family protein n=1 Tax=Ohtaekwangia sp. TaxID=2066019 RepID=UPI002F934D2B